MTHRLRILRRRGSTLPFAKCQAPQVRADTRGPATRCSDLTAKPAPGHPGHPEVARAPLTAVAGATGYNFEQGTLMTQERAGLGAGVPAAAAVTTKTRTVGPAARKGVQVAPVRRCRMRSRGLGLENQTEVG
jgi:hypothetical protein